MKRGEMSAKKKVESMLADTSKLKAEMIANARKENPRLTDEQLEAMWQQAAHQLGL